jgi:hypothetical protein
MTIAERFDALLKAGDAMSSQLLPNPGFVENTDDWVATEIWHAVRKALPFTGNDLAELVKMSQGVANMLRNHYAFDRAHEDMPRELVLLEALLAKFKCEVTK